ncbi:MAG: hypothetical protein IJP43_06040 [Oscillospiraceae bacterium]|nr:hypothetical protein [Oscillospiraceae bacterium]
MAKKSELKCRGFIGDRPIEELTEEELEAWRERVAQRFSAVFSDYYSNHIEEYQKI